jgi:DNA (cytosine-5)-methyltransferase 1
MFPDATHRGLTFNTKLQTIRPMTITGAELRTKRQQLGLSQAKLAELTGVPQSFLSAFELGKLDIGTAQLIAIQHSLADRDKVKLLVTRSKRVRKHEYSSIVRDPTRVAKASRTARNAEYTELLDRLHSAHLKEKADAPTAISLFSGCGGFSLGFSAAGYKIKGFLELEDELRAIYRTNFPGTVEMGDDITKVSGSRLAELKDTIGSVDAIIGGPPCQGFSLSGKREINDPRNTLFRHYLRFVDAFRPKFAILENVRLLTSMKNADKGYVRDDICNEFHKHGYKVDFFEINASDFGVPQHRERVLFVAIRMDLELGPSLPTPSHENSSSLFSSLSPVRTFADATSDLPYLESGEHSADVMHAAVTHPSHVIEWLWNVKEGFSAHDNEDPELRPPSGYNTTYKRQIWSQPAATVQTTFGMISGCRNVHPIATRSMTIREAARLQSFPDQYKFVGTLGAMRTGIGNAVPPLLAFELGKFFMDRLNLVKIPSL